MMKRLKLLTKYLPTFVRKHLSFATASRHEPDHPSESNEAVMEKDHDSPLLQLPKELRRLIFDHIFEDFALCMYVKQVNDRE